jgi:hypothetical protein
MRIPAGSPGFQGYSCEKKLFSVLQPLAFAVRNKNKSVKFLLFLLTMPGEVLNPLNSYPLPYGDSAIMDESPGFFFEIIRSAYIR